MSGSLECQPPLPPGSPLKCGLGKYHSVEGEGQLRKGQLWGGSHPCWSGCWWECGYLGATHGLLNKPNKPTGPPNWTWVELFLQFVLSALLRGELMDGPVFPGVTQSQSSAIYWFFSVRSSDSSQDKAEGGGQEAGLGTGLHRLAPQALPASHTHGKVQDTCPGLSWAETPLLGESVTSGVIGRIPGLEAGSDYKNDSCSNS